jgi:hypothetical protein
MVTARTTHNDRKEIARLGCRPMWIGILAAAAHFLLSIFLFIGFVSTMGYALDGNGPSLRWDRALELAVLALQLPLAAPLFLNGWRLPFPLELAIVALNSGLWGAAVRYLYLRTRSGSAGRESGR